MSSAIPDIVLFNVKGRSLRLLREAMALNDDFRNFGLKECHVTRSTGSAGVAFAERGKDEEFYHPLIFVDTADSYAKRDAHRCATHISKILCRNIKERHLIIIMTYDNDNPLLTLLTGMRLTAQSLPLRLNDKGKGEIGFLGTAEEISKALSLLWRQCVAFSGPLPNEPF